MKKYSVGTILCNQLTQTTVVGVVYKHYGIVDHNSYGIIVDRLDHIAAEPIYVVKWIESGKITRFYEYELDTFQIVE